MSPRGIGELIWDHELAGVAWMRSGWHSITEAPLRHDQRCPYAAKRVALHPRHRQIWKPSQPHLHGDIIGTHRFTSISIEKLLRATLVEVEDPLFEPQRGKGSDTTVTLSDPSHTNFAAGVSNYEENAMPVPIASHPIAAPSTASAQFKLGALTTINCPCKPECAEMLYATQSDPTPTRPSSVQNPMQIALRCALYPVCFHYPNADALLCEGLSSRPRRAWSSQPVACEMSKASSVAMAHARRRRETLDGV